MFKITPTDTNSMIISCSSHDYYYSVVISVSSRGQFIFLRSDRFNFIRGEGERIRALFQNALQESLCKVRNWLVFKTMWLFLFNRSVEIFLIHFSRIYFFYNFYNNYSRLPWFSLFRVFEIYKREKISKEIWKFEINIIEIPKRSEVALKRFLSSILIWLVEEEKKKINNDPKANYWLVNVSVILNF